MGPGSYFVSFVPLPNYQFSPKDEGTDDTIDSDVDATGQTDVFALALDQDIATIDAGFVLGVG